MKRPWNETDSPSLFLASVVATPQRNPLFCSTVPFKGESRIWIEGYSTFRVKRVVKRNKKIYSGVRPTCVHFSAETSDS